MYSFRINTVLSPTAADAGWVALFIARFFLGFGVSFTWASVMTVGVAWAGENELGTVIAIGGSGFQAGNCTVSVLNR